MKAFSVGKKYKPLKIKVDEVMSWSDEAAISSLLSDNLIRHFKKLENLQIRFK